MAESGERNSILEAFPSCCVSLDLCLCGGNPLNLRYTGVDSHGIREKALSQNQGNSPFPIGGVFDWAPWRLGSQGCWDAGIQVLYGVLMCRGAILNSAGPSNLGFNILHNGLFWKHIVLASFMSS